MSKDFEFLERRRDRNRRMYDTQDGFEKADEISVLVTAQKKGEAWGSPRGALNALGTGWDVEDRWKP